MPDYADRIIPEPVIDDRWKSNKGKELLRLGRDLRFVKKILGCSWPKMAQLGLLKWI